MKAAASVLGRVVTINLHHANVVDDLRLHKGRLFGVKLLLGSELVVSRLAVGYQRLKGLELF